MKTILSEDEINRLDYFKYADKSIKYLNRKFARKALSVKSELLKKKFNNNDVFEEFVLLYQYLVSESEIEFLKLADTVYQKNSGKSKKTFSKKWLRTNVTDIPIPTTKYIYSKEAERKRNRAIEAINASDTYAKKSAELTKAMRMFSAQTKFYADYVTEIAAEEAMADSGENKVLWITKKDEKVCEICSARDNAVYDIGNIPERHLRCRCILIPFTD